MHIRLHFVCVYIKVVSQTEGGLFNSAIGLPKDFYLFKSIFITVNFYWFPLLYNECSYLFSFTIHELNFFYYFVCIDAKLRVWKSQESIPLILASIFVEIQFVTDLQTTDTLTLFLELTNYRFLLNSPEFLRHFIFDILLKLGVDSWFEIKRYFESIDRARIFITLCSHLF